MLVLAFFAFFNWAIFSACSFLAVVFFFLSLLLYLDETLSIFSRDIIYLSYLGAGVGEPPGSELSSSDSTGVIGLFLLLTLIEHLHKTNAEHIEPQAYPFLGLLAAFFFACSWCLTAFFDSGLDSSLLYFNFHLTWF